MKVIRCECGFVIRGATDMELLRAANAHIQDAHPALVGHVTDEDLLATAEIVA